MKDYGERYTKVEANLITYTLIGKMLEQTYLFEFGCYKVNSIKRNRNDIFVRNMKEVTR